MDEILMARKCFDDDDDQHEDCQTGKRICNSKAKLKRTHSRLSYTKNYTSLSLIISVIIIVFATQSSLSQSPQENCNSGSSIASFICKASQTVLGGASRLASSIISRPKHWGVPEGEKLELEDDFNRKPNPQVGHNGLIATSVLRPLNNNNIGARLSPHQVSQPGNPDRAQYHRHNQAPTFDEPPISIDENYLRGYGHKKHRLAEQHSNELSHSKELLRNPSNPNRCHAIDGKPGICMPMPACYHKHGSSIRYKLDESQECPRGHSLVCCPVQSLRQGSDYEEDNNANGKPAIMKERFAMLQSAAKQQQSVSGKIAIDKLRDIVSQVFREPKSSQSARNDEIERNIVQEGFALRRDSPSDLHQRFIQLRNNKLVSKLAKDGSDFLEIATRVAKQQQKQSNDSRADNGFGRPAATGECSKQMEIEGTGSSSCFGHNQQHDENDSMPKFNRRVWLPEIDFSQTDLSSRCPGDPICPRDAAFARYRTYDGSCNNLIHTAWGKSNTPYTRILPPDYEDGVNELRLTGVTGAALPNPRTVSLASVDWADKSDQKASLMLMQWGQFIDHDVTLAATTPMLTPDGSNIDCCNRRLLSDPRFRHPACISVLLPDLDPFYSPFKVGCMNMVRSAPSPPIGCRLRAREQLNQLTHFIDGSMVYGNDEQQALALRQFRGGLLKSSRINGAEFLPFDRRLGEGCILPTDGIKRGMRCFVAGDNRVNELTGLVTTHAMFLREHNRIARILGHLNRDWSDERLYQESRRIVIAQIQHITYNEWLPLLLGPVVMRDFQLQLGISGHTFDYDPQTEPTIINEFAGAAYRLHSLVQSAFNFQTEDGQLIQQFKLRNIFNNPASLYREGNYDGCIHSMVNEPSQAVDNHFTEELTNHLFQDTNSSFGMDLVTVNIQRGRDHGIPGYNFFRQACGLTRIKSFEQLDSVMVAGASRVFAELYAHVDDIDLFIAGSYEKKLKEAMVGPVFACIIGEQFRRLKVGDRYWYKNGNQAGAFSPAQLAQIERASMGRIICDNSDLIERIQPLAFLRPTDWNPKVPCEQLPWIDLRVWAVRRGNGLGGGVSADDFDRQPIMHEHRPGHEEDLAGLHLGPMFGK